MKATAIVHTEPLPNSPERFSTQALQQLVDQAPGMTVIAEFDPSRPIGRVVDAQFTDEGVEVTMDLVSTPGEPLDVGPTYFAKESHATETGERVIDELSVFSFGVWHKP